MAKFRVTTPDGADEFEAHDFEETNSGGLRLFKDFANRYELVVLFANECWIRVERFEE